MKIRFTSFILILICSIGCSSHQIPGYMKSQKGVMNESRFSSGFNVFLTALSEEAEGNSLDQFVPSENLIKQFSLKKIDGLFNIFGFLQTDHSFQEKEVEKIGGKLIPYSLQIYSFHIPIESIQKLIQIKGITFIEINQKTRTKQTNTKRD